MNLAIEIPADARKITNTKIADSTVKGFLVVIQWETNVGYAFLPLERSFFEMARSLTGDPSRVFFAYRDLSGGSPKSLPKGFGNVTCFDATSSAPEEMARIAKYIADNQIDTVFGFDWPVHLPCYRSLRQAGVKTIVGYWGAPVSSINRGLKLFLKRLDVARRRFGPDHYIFESEAMRETASNGRGIPASRTSVVYLGVDCEQFRPAKSSYVYDTFAIPSARKVIFYSGHMLERKGVHIIVAAAAELINNRGRKDLHFLFAGDRPGEAERYAPLYQGTPAAEFITFAGYRNDLAAILPGCYAGVIASVGWDSLTMSSMEMQACGLPLLVSNGSSANLQGLREAIEDGVTGQAFPPGDVQALADHIAALADDPGRRDRMSRAARARVERRFSVTTQRLGLIEVMGRLLKQRQDSAPSECIQGSPHGPIRIMQRHGTTKLDDQAGSFGGKRGLATFIRNFLRSCSGAFDRHQSIDWRRVYRVIFVCRGNICGNCRKQASCF